MAVINGFKYLTTPDYLPKYQLDLMSGRLISPRTNEKTLVVFLLRRTNTHHITTMKLLFHIYVYIYTLELEVFTSIV